MLVYTNEAGQRIEAPAPFAVNPPAEWLPTNGEPGAENLAAWAQSTGGRVLTAETAFTAKSGISTGVSNSSSAWWWRILLALVLLWPLEIALRRRWLPWMQV